MALYRLDYYYYYYYYYYYLLLLCFRGLHHELATNSNSTESCLMSTLPRLTELLAFVTPCVGLPYYPEHCDL